MRKLSIDEVKLGMVIAADIFDSDFGGDFPLIGRGVELTEGIISKMKERFISEVLVITPPGYRGAPGEIFAPVEISEDIFFEGRVELGRDVPAGTRIVAGESIFISGEVQKGCSITSAKGDILVNGRVIGEQDSRVILNAAGCVTVNNQKDKPIQYADIKSINEIVIDGNVVDSSLSTKGKLIVHGKVERSNLYSQTRIRVFECGDDLSRTPSQLLVKPAECRTLFQELLTIDKQLSSQQKEKERLQNTLDLIRKLGRSVEQLPADKKMQLASDVKQFQAVDNSLNAGLKEKERIRKEISDSLAVNRILITHLAHANTKVTIENMSLVLEKTVEKAAFYVQNMKLERETLRE